MAALVLASVFLHSTHPQKNPVGSKEGEKYFHPSKARTASGNFIPASTLMMDDYCLKCHEDAYKGWLHSSHRFSSFNNPFYLFSVKETRDVGLRRDGNVKASRWCAGCHDVVPFFSGAFDDPNYDIHNHPTAKAGITCTACHAITHVNDTTGNAAYTIDEPIHYPFAYSTNAALQWINNQLVKAKPDFHKKMFLKPFMKTEEYCSTCHKVGLPFEVTHYKEFLRGQNHYDTFLLSGAGHGARSFYYPPKAEKNCNDCHMPLKPSADFAAQYFNPTNPSQRFIHDHLFPSANNALPHLRGDQDIVAEHAKRQDRASGLRRGRSLMDPASLADRARDLAKGAATLSQQASDLAAQAAAGAVPEAHGHPPFIFLFTVFVLACFVGYHVVWRVTPALHSPLMAVTNAISSVIIVGALLAAGASAVGFSQVLGFIAIVLASVNIVGGFAVTQRMLGKFTTKKK